MKKTVMILLLSLMALSFASAQEIDLGDFPVGKWLDAEYDAVWTFSSNNIELYLTDGTKVYDFQNKIQDFDVKGSLKGVELSFSCADTARKYKFVKGVSNLDLDLIIDKDSGLHYETEMKMQK